MKIRNLLLLFLLIPLFLSAGELSLERAIAMAIENNLDLKMSELDVDKAKWDLIKSYSSFLPSFGITWSQMKQELDIDPVTLMMFSSMPGGAAAMGLAEEINNIDLSLGVPIIIGGTRFFATKLSHKALDLARGQNDIQRSTIEFQTKVNFLTLLFLKETVKIQQEAVDLAADEYKVMEKQYEAGEIPEPLLTAQRVAMRDEMNSLKKSKSDYKIALERFRRFLKTDETILPIGSLEETFPKFEKKALLEKVDEARTVGMMEKQISLLKDASWMTLTPMMPSVIYSWNVNHKTDEFSWESGDWYSKGVSMLIVDIPLFTQTNAFFEFKKSKKDLEKAQLGLQSMKDELETEVISSLMEIENIKDSYELLKLNYEMARDNYSATKTAFERGEMSYTDLEKAQLLLSRTKLGFMGTLLQKEIAVAKIEFLLN